MPLHESRRRTNSQQLFCTSAAAIGCNARVSAQEVLLTPHARLVSCCLCSGIACRWHDRWHAPSRSPATSHGRAAGCEGVLRSVEGSTGSYLLANIAVVLAEIAGIL